MVTIGDFGGTFKPWTDFSTTIEKSNPTDFYANGKTTDSDIYRIGIYGWRKRCLYSLILLLIVFIVINLAMTIWIMRVMKFNLYGMGGLRIEPDGLRLTGRTQFDHPVSFSRMTSLTQATVKRIKPNDHPSLEQHQPFVVESQAGLALISRSKSKTSRFLDNQTAKIIIENNEVKAYCNQFEILDCRGRPVMTVGRRNTALRIEDLRVLGDQGASFQQSVQTRLIKSVDPHRPLVLESPTRGLNVTAAQHIHAISRAGDAHLEAMRDVRIESLEGRIELNSPNIFFSHLNRKSINKKVDKNDVVDDLNKRKMINNDDQYYQVCICSKSGLLYLSASNTDCRSGSDICTSG